MPEFSGHDLMAARPEEFGAAVEAGVRRAAALRDACVDAAATGGDWRTVLDRYDEAVAELANLHNFARAVRAVHPDPDRRGAAQAGEALLARAAAEMELDGRVVDALDSVGEAIAGTPVQHWVDRGRRRMRAAGAGRNPAERTRIGRLRDRIVELEQTWEHTIAADTLEVTVPATALAGLPDEYLRSHEANGDGRVRVSTDRPDLQPFLARAHDEAARAAVWRTSRRRAAGNVAVLRDLLTARHELATLLGYQSYAHLALADTMAGTPAVAQRFLDTVSATVRPIADRQYAQLLAYKRVADPAATEVWPWDMAYLLDQATRQRVPGSGPVQPQGFDAAWQALLHWLERLYAVVFVCRPHLPVWHPDVATYDVAGRDGVLLGRIYVDIHRRPGKPVGPSMYELVRGKSGRRLPECLILAGLDGAGGALARLSRVEMLALAHEFGHAMHHLLAGHGDWSATSGLAMEWDFVETPSYVVEHWARDARTGLVEETADATGRALAICQQLFYAQVSLELHTADPARLDAAEVERRAWYTHTPLPPVDDALHYPTFGHLAGYSATYYTYIWSQVIARDLAEAVHFGQDSTDTALARYRAEILVPGGARPAGELVHAYLGRQVGLDGYARWLAGA